MAKLEKRIGLDIWSEDRRWSAWVNTDPQGRFGGDAVEVERFRTRAQAEARVAESERGGFVRETTVDFGQHIGLCWADIIPGGEKHYLWGSL